MSSSRQQGMTLIELMIVVAIISILTAIAVPNFMSMQNRAKEGSLRVSMMEFQEAVEDYAVQHNFAYPTSVDQVIPFLPDAHPQTNPFTRKRMAYNRPTEGNILYESDGKLYLIRGCGTRAVLGLVLENINGRGAEL